MSECPVPWSRYERVVLAHGGGGRVMQQLIDGLFRAAYDSPELATGHDAVQLGYRGPVVVTTDGFTVSPRFFAGGDLGSLAVHGSVNDLAMGGARARHLTVGFILEEGLPLQELERLVHSLAAAARAADVHVVAGDTKVVERGKGDGVFITCTALGEPLGDEPPAPSRVRAGDALLLSGPVGEHGAAVLAARERLPIEGDLQSDAGSVAGAVTALYEAGIRPHCLRDATRGGLATVVCEVSQQSGLGTKLHESAIAVREPVQDLCELMGLDPLYVACEGRFVAWIAEEQAERALQVLTEHPQAPAPAIIGRVAQAPGGVVIEGPFGRERVLDLLSGEQLPRIC